MDGAFVVAAKQARVDGYLLKPFTPGQFQEKIEAILQSASRRSVYRFSAKTHGKPRDQRPSGGSMTA
jgi:DNA-binding response OmpR family regulator